MVTAAANQKYLALIQNVYKIAKKRLVELIEHVFKIISVKFGAILMFYYGVMDVKLKQDAQIWHFEIKAVKNNMSLREL